MGVKRMGCEDIGPGTAVGERKRSRELESDDSENRRKGIINALELSSLSEAFDSLAQQHPGRLAVEDDSGLQAQ